MVANADPEFLDRLVIHRFALDDILKTFAGDVQAGLTANPKTLLPKYFYDRLGSHLFEAICCLPEYYVTRAENEILREHTNEIIDQIGGSASARLRLIEFGSGSAAKTHHLIDALLRRQREVHYLPIDVSATNLERSAEDLLRDFPGLRITAYATDYSNALQALAQAKASAQQDHEQTVILFLGSSIGNLDPDESRAFLRESRQVLEPGDSLFIGADLKKPADVLVPAYDDALGVTAAFNLNLLVRINRELGGDFNVMKFTHRAVYNERAGRIEMHLLSREPQVVRIGAMDLQVSFAQGESIHTENSYKFDLDQLSQLAHDTGFSPNKTWLDSRRRFSFNLFAAV
jgi:L-histidine N-alpha-methyltransferase